MKKRGIKRPIQKRSKNRPTKSSKATEREHVERSESSAIAQPVAPPVDDPATMFGQTTTSPTDRQQAARTGAHAQRRAGGRPRAVDWDQPLTVVVVARALGVSKNTVRNMVQRGELRPIDGSFPLQFSREEVLRVASLSGTEVESIPNDGETAAAAFAAFRAGKPVRDVVIDLKIGPDQAERLLHRYVAMGGDMVLPGEVIRQIQEIGFMAGRQFNPYELPMILRDLLRRIEETDPEIRAARAAWGMPSAKVKANP